MFNVYINIVSPASYRFAEFVVIPACFSYADQDVDLVHFLYGDGM